MDSPNDLKTRADRNYNQKKYERAAQLYGKLCRLEHVMPHWLQRLGESRQRSGDQGGAIHAYRQAAMAYAQEGEPLKAVALCKLALSIDPNHSEAQSLLSRLIARPDAFRQAEEPASLWEERTPLGTPHPRTYFPVGEELPLTPEPVAPYGDPELSFRDEELTGPPVPRPFSFDSGQTPAGESFFSFEDSPRGARPTNQPARYPMTAPRTPEGTPPDQPAAAPSPKPRMQPGPAAQAPPARRPDLRRGDVSAPAIQALEPLVPLEDINLRDVIVDAREMEEEPARHSGVFHIPIPDGQTRVQASFGDRRLELDSLLRNMPRVPLLSSLSPEALRTFIEKVQLKAFYSGETIFTQGDQGTSMYILVQGDVSVSHTEREITKRLGTLSEGSFFGEVGLITASERMFTVEARSDVMALVVSRKLASALVREHPPVLKVLLRFMRDRLANTVAETHELFAPFTTEERRQLIKKFKFLEAKRGAQLLEQDKHSRGMHLLLAGKAEVLRDSEVLRKLQPGDIFGKTSILANKPSLNSVLAISKCWLLRLDQETLQDTIMTHPKVLAALGSIGMTAPHRAFKGGAEPPERLKIV